MFGNVLRIYLKLCLFQSSATVILFAFEVDYAQTEGAKVFDGFEKEFNKDTKYSS